MAGEVAAGAGEWLAAGGRFCRHWRNTKNRLTAATGTSIHGHGDPFFSGSLIVLPTSTRLCSLLSRPPPRNMNSVIPPVFLDATSAG
jgi:hypothetical protein